MAKTARTARCAHADAMPVESAVTGEVLAALCPVCDEQLPAEILDCPHRNVISVPMLGEPPGRAICNDCGTSGWYGTTPRSVVTVTEPVTAEELERLKAQLAEPYRVLYLPHMADPDGPTSSEIDHGIPLEWL